MIGWFSYRFTYPGRRPERYWGKAAAQDELGASDAAIQAYLEDHDETDLDDLLLTGGFAGYINPGRGEDFDATEWW